MKHIKNDRNIIIRKHNKETINKTIVKRKDQPEEDNQLPIAFKNSIIKFLPSYIILLSQLDE